MSSPQQQLLETLRSRGIQSSRVLAAMGSVPRDRFVPDELQAKAWDDTALPIGCEQTISQPFVVAWMTEHLELTGEETILEIGTGSGYQTAILAQLANHVVTIERHSTLSNSAQTRLASLGIRNVDYHIGDGTLGWPDSAPYDAIIVTAGAPEIPAPLYNQLKTGGRLVIPIGSRSLQQMEVITKTEQGPKTQQLGGCRFVQLIGNHGWDTGPSIADHSD